MTKALASIGSNFGSKYFLAFSLELMICSLAENWVTFASIDASTRNVDKLSTSRQICFNRPSAKFRQTPLSKQPSNQPEATKSVVGLNNPGWVYFIRTKWFVSVKLPSCETYLAKLIGFELRPHWLESSSLSTVLPLLPAYCVISSVQLHNLAVSFIFKP